MKVKLLSRVQHLATPWTAACQAPPSMGFSRQEYWNGVPLPSLGHRQKAATSGLEVEVRPSARGGKGNLLEGLEHM